MDEFLPDDVDHQLTRMIRRSRVRGLRLAAEIDPRLDYSGYLLLHAIHDASEGIRGTELAELFGVHKSTISRGTNALERLGLVERRPDPSDGRAQLLCTTAQARSKIVAIRQRTHSWLADRLADWTETERLAFAANLTRFNDAAEHTPID